MAQTVELVGGPKDGEMIALPDGEREYRIALPNALLDILHGPASALRPLFRVGVYRRELDGAFHWLGEE